MNWNRDPPARVNRRSSVATRWQVPHSAVMSAAVRSASAGYSVAQWWPSVAAAWPQNWQTPSLRSMADWRATL